VLRATASSTPTELANDVDAALLRDLAAIAGITNPMVSPVDYAEVQLSVGCTDEARACLEAVARAANVDALVIRTISGDDGGLVRLELRYFDSASSDEPAVVSTEETAPMRDELVPAVPGLVRQLFGIPEIAAPAESTPVEQEASGPPPRSEPRPAPRKPEGHSVVLPWVLIGAGAAVLTTGIILGAVAADDYSAWKKRPIESTEQADQANEDLDRLKTRALAANIVMPVGAVTLGLGVTWLVLQLSGEHDSRTTLALEPRPGGALLQVHGTFQEGW